MLIIRLLIKKYPPNTTLIFSLSVYFSCSKKWLTINCIALIFEVKTVVINVLVCKKSSKKSSNKDKKK